jgi:hypothetical protein
VQALHFAITISNLNNPRSGCGPGEIYDVSRLCLFPPSPFPYFISSSIKWRVSTCRIRDHSFTHVGRVRPLYSHFIRPLLIKHNQSGRVADENGREQFRVKNKTDLLRWSRGFTVVGGSVDRVIARRNDTSHLERAKFPLNLMQNDATKCEREDAKK